MSLWNSSTFEREIQDPGPLLKKEVPHLSPIELARFVGAS
jgi:hypothetical protein